MNKNIFKFLLNIYEVIYTNYPNQHLLVGIVCIYVSSSTYAILWNSGKYFSSPNLLRERAGGVIKHVIKHKYD